MAGNWVYVFQGLPHSFAIPLWTVSIEEQFYLTWPLALRKATPRRIAIFAIGVLLLAHVLRAWMVIDRRIGQCHGIQHVHPAGSHRVGNTGCAFRRPIAIIRALAALGFDHGRIAACISAYAMSALENHATVSTWQMAASHTLTAIGSVAVMLGVLGATHSFFRNKALIYLGKISYGLYVIHELAHLLARQIFPPLRQ